LVKPLDGGVRQLNPSTLLADGSANFQVLLEDGERVFCRVGSHADGSVLSVLPAAEHPTPATLDRLAHEYGRKEELDGAWAVRPLELIREGGRTMLVLEDPGGEPLERLLGVPFEIDLFLRLAIDISVAVGRLHRRGLLHKDIKPANIMVNCADGQVRLTGFGIASRVPRERQAPEPLATIAGTLAYMAPEQTGRMNRSIDSRSDLYALGVTFYQMLTNSLPFTAADPMEWVHCHIARKPLPPSERSKNIPVPVSEIIMKLLAKTAEERYQTAAGIESDLRHCLAERERKGRIDPFALGEHDVPDRLLLPEKLYGRAREIETLLACFDRMVNSGAVELVLVSGYSGIGKSSVVNELHRVLVEPRGLFASGKFDRYKHDIPYSTLAQAFQSLIRPLLGKSDPELAGWREAFREALGPNGRLIVDLVPELKHIVGDQPPVPELPPRDAQRRFRLVFRRFLAVFARPEHPLALFLDDLQWLDSATLDLLEDLLTQPDVQHLMLIGAYRDNEVNSAHPLIRKLEAIRKAGAVVHEIILAPLSPEDLGRLIGDALHCEPERVTALAELIHEKTAGNPFFANQLISALVEEGLLTFDYGEGRWSWDLNSIRAKGYTDNVVDLMVGKLNRLPVETQQALQLLACMGNSAEFALLEMASQQSNEEMHGQLWEAVRAGLISRADQSYTFLHDRVQEAAYSLIRESRRAETHVRIGRLLVAHIPPEQQEERIFDIVNQLNRGSHLISSAEEGKRLAELNLIAGRRAKSSTAYTSALSYLDAARALLAEEAWNDEYDLIFAIESNMAECELLSADMAAAENRLLMLAQRAKRAHDIALITGLRVTLYKILGRSDRGVEVALEYLRNGGTDWSMRPTREEVVREYDRIWSQLGSRKVEELFDLALMANPNVLHTMDVLNEIIVPAHDCDENLPPLIICRMVNLSLEHGNCDASCVAYLGLAMIAGPLFGNYSSTVLRFGQLGYDLVEQRGLKRFRARIYAVFGDIIMPWTRHVRAGRDLIRRAFDAANETGDLAWAAYSRSQLITILLASGEQLAEVQREAEDSLVFLRKVRFGIVIDIVTTQLALIRTLRGLTPRFGCLDDGDMDEPRMEHHLSSNPVLGIATCWYWIRKLQARYLAGDYAAAIDASSKAQRLLWTSPSHPETVDFCFYGALSHAASWDFAPPDQKQRHFEALEAHHNQLKIWAQNCSENFENRVALVGAEIARIEGRELDAERCYEQAIGSARANGFIHNEALAYELAARFYAARGFKQIADLYLRNAHHGYLRWGAVGKARQLDETYPDLRQEQSFASPMSTIGAPVEHLDLATVIKVSQAVSGEIVLESLIETLMRTAIAQAGAERALLIMLWGQEPRIEAEATTSGDTVTVRLVDETVTERVLPESVLHYVLRSREIVILEDAAVKSPFGVDSYIRQRQVRSILCLPLLNQAKLIGVLYLENNLTPRAFAPARISVLKLLASQAAIALENAHLYRDVGERETRIRRLVDSNIIGIFIWDFEGRIREANDEFLRMVGYDRDDLVSGRIGWADLTPPDWRDRNNARIERQKSSGRFEPFEKEYTRKDGSRVPVLIGGATFEEGGNQGVAFVLDLTVRKRAEQALMRSEAYLAQAQKLTHMGSWVWDPRTEKVLYCSEEMFRIFGLDPRESLPSRDNFRQQIHPEDRDWVTKRFEESLRDRVDTFAEYRVLLPDGTTRHINASGHPVLNGNGELIEFIGTATDVTERTRAAEALRESEAKFSDYAATASDWLWEIGPDYRYTLLTENAFHSDAADRIGTFCWDHALDLETEPEKWRLVWATLDSRKPFGDFVYCSADGSGSPMYVKVSGKPVFDANGNFRGYRGTGTDVTALRTAEAEARENERRYREVQLELAHANRVATMGQLTASITHEVNQPITAAVTYALAARRFLNAEPPDFHEVDDALSLIVKEGNRAGEVVGRIRALIKKAPARKDAVEINDAILEVVALTRTEAANNSVAVRTQLAEGLPCVQGDRVQLQQVLLNLIINAIEAMRDVSEGERELLVSSRNVPDGVIVEVRDSGPGFAPADIDRVFEAFYSTKPSGLGLGLSICRSIIEAHNGRLWASPNAPRGASFGFIAPAYPAAAT
jgi:PAS domain S-box-containing protein